MILIYLRFLFIIDMTFDTGSSWKTTRQSYFLTTSSSKNGHYFKKIFKITYFSKSQNFLFKISKHFLYLKS